MMIMLLLTTNYNAIAVDNNAVAADDDDYDDNAVTDDNAVDDHESSRSIKFITSEQSERYRGLLGCGEKHCCGLRRPSTLLLFHRSFNLRAYYIAPIYDV
ncbi:hypothetical protein M8J77_017612 [Diaphorina citri]|nr:hypothetical protein M8J77_017612 [Diaphorina citri]